jgi:hypothetical protein
VICNLDNSTPEEIISYLGMVVPSIRSPQDYVIDNIVFCSNILTRGTFEELPIDIFPHLDPVDTIMYLSHLTDQEIFNLCGVYVPYSMRKNLIVNMMRNFHNENFMIPIIRSYDKAINRLTISQNKIIDPEIFVVCYGTPIKYFIYEIEDLICSFKLNHAGDGIEFKKPETIDKRFTVVDIENLRLLLTSIDLEKIKEKDEILKLIEIIDQGLAENKDKLDFDKIACENLSQCDEKNQNLIKEFLEDVFHSGLKMRGWKGPEDPFPLREEMVKHDEDSDYLISQSLYGNMILLGNMDKEGKKFCDELKVCQYNDMGQIEYIDDLSKNSIENFGDLFQRVTSDKECYKVASSKFLGTGYHYLRVLFDHTIPGVDTRNIDIVG